MKLRYAGLITVIALWFALMSGLAKAVDLEPNCIAQWMMNDAAASTVVVDSQGFSNGTSVRDTCDMATEGKVGGAMVFNGTSDYIDTNNSFQTIWQNSFSINLWVKVYDGRGLLQFLFSAYSSVLPGNEVTYFIGSDGKIGGVYIANGPSLDITENNPSFTDGQNDWKMVTIIVTQMTPTIAALVLYVNGSLRAEVSGDVILADYTSSLNPFIGAMNDDDTPVSFFKGALDNVMIFNKALSTDEIAFLYNGGAGTEELNYNKKVLMRKN
ncbi:MAG: LamG domain-containing protein [Planctomycetota bacterium]